MLVVGIDEAGRGCVIGPLVIAGIMVKEEDIAALAALGVKDSKLLTPKKREKLAPEIMRLAQKYIVLKVSPQQIDKVVERQRYLHKLNRLEAQVMAQIVEQLEPDIVYVDAADVKEKRFGQHIIEASAYKCKIVSEHKADVTYPVVSAASILAKVERDNAVAALREELGDFGCGYLTDPKTTLFLKQWIENHDDYPLCIRQSWKPAKAIKNGRGTQQTKLF
jgi:ribonuclease HII